MSRSLAGRPLAALSLGILASLSVAAVASAHEARTVAGYDLEVGFIDEPVFVGERSGLEFFVHKADQPVTGLEQTVKATVTFGSQTRDLPVSARDDDPGAYESVFIPTAAGPYTFHLTGSIEGNAIDESFTSSPTGFDEVRDVASGQFPVQFPSEADLAAQATAGQQASSQLPIAIGLSVVGIVVGLVGVGLALTGRRRPA